MRVLSFVMSAALFFSSSIPVSAESTRIEEGTLVRLKLQDSVSTKDSSAGQKVQFTVVEDVTAGEGGPVVIKSGASALGYLINADESKTGESGKLCIEIRSANGIDGTKVPLRGVKAKSGKGGAGVGSYVVGGLFFGLIGLGAVALFGRGKNAKIPAGTVVTAFVDRDTELNGGVSIAGQQPGLNVKGSRLISSPTVQQSPQLRGLDDSFDPHLFERANARN